MSASWHQVRRVSSRLSWGVADQGASSLTNFLLNILVARTLGAEQFGAFTLAYVTYGFALNASRALSIEPLLVRFGVTNMKTWRRATSASTGTALLVGLVLGTLALAAAIVMGGTTGEAFLGLGLMLPGLMLQDSWRYAFFAARIGHHALINDVLWAVVEIPVLLILKATGHVNVFWFVIAWGAGAAAGAVFGAFQARAVPNLNMALSWLRTHRDLGPRFLVENCGGNGASTLQSYTISSFLGLESVGYMQAANILMGPFRILSFGIGMMTIPEAAALMRRAPRKALRFCVALGFGADIARGGLDRRAAHSAAPRTRALDTWQPMGEDISAGSAHGAGRHGGLRWHRRGHRAARHGGREAEHEAVARQCGDWPQRCLRGLPARQHTGHLVLDRCRILVWRGVVVVAVPPGDA